jgi:DNA polymerase I-like protein with 3'-5' exonuclease and polymerase domains
MLMYYLLREDVRHDLKSAAVLRLGVEPWEHGVRDRLKRGDIPDDSEFALYCASDCVYLARLYEDLRKEILSYPDLARLYRYLLLPASWTFRRVKERGIHVSLEAIEAARRTCIDKATAARKTLIATSREAGVEGLNPNSPKQLSDLLFARLHLPVIEWTKTGQASTKEYVLKRLRGKHPVVDAQLEFRHWDKLGNFLNQYESHADLVDHRMHPGYSLSFLVCP